jgi:signal-transduction protein with cAMP-binding, CBS, and nucleotidyltransferase domain
LVEGRFARPLAIVKWARPIPVRLRTALRAFRNEGARPYAQVLATEEAPVARDEKLDLLHSIPLFARFDRQHLERLGMLTEEVDVPAGKVLIRQGELGDDLMVLVTGKVAVERDGARVNELGPGDFFGEIALIDHGPRTATVTVESPSRLLVVNHRDFHALMDEFPQVAATVLLCLAERLRSLDRAAVQ